MLLSLSYAGATLPGNGVNYRDVGVATTSRDNLLKHSQYSHCRLTLDESSSEIHQICVSALITARLIAIMGIVVSS